MEPFTASFLLCSLKSIFCLHPWSSKKVSLTVAIHFKGSLLLLMPPMKRTLHLSQGLEWVKEEKVQQYFLLPLKGSWLIDLSAKRDTSTFVLLLLQTGRPVPITNYNCRSKAQKSEAWKKKTFCFPRTDLTLSKTMLWLTAQKGNTPRFVPEQNIRFFYATEGLIWSQSRWLDLCYWNSNTKAVSQRMAGCSYFSLEIVV